MSFAASGAARSPSLLPLTPDPSPVPGSSAPLACGDVYDSPATTKFAALCHSTFDIAPGTTVTDLINENKSPVCGAYVAGRKSLTGAWLSTSEDASAWVTVGGDGAFSCVGTAAVQCV